MCYTWINPVSKGLPNSVAEIIKSETQTFKELRKIVYLDEQTCNYRSCDEEWLEFFKLILDEDNPIIEEMQMHFDYRRDATENTVESIRSKILSRLKEIRSLDKKRLALPSGWDGYLDNLEEDARSFFIDSYKITIEYDDNYSELFPSIHHLGTISIDGETPPTTDINTLCQVLFDSIHCLDNRPIRERIEMMEGLSSPDSMIPPDIPIFHENLALTWRGTHGEMSRAWIHVSVGILEQSFDEIGYFSRDKKSWAKAFNLLRITIEGLVDNAECQETGIVVRGVSGACYSISPAYTDEGVHAPFRVSLLEENQRFDICIVPDEHGKELPFPDLLTTAILSLRNDLYASREIDTLRSALEARQQRGL